MKICACIAEYNPLHLGHLKHIEYIKSTLGADKLIVIMSGNFTQRGEPAVSNKYKRARQAVIAGADLVIELPTVFATANAEIFAKGAIKILNSLGCVEGVCFGVESGDKESYFKLASAMNNESKEFKKLLKENLEGGISLAKAKFLTLKQMGEEFDEGLISSPNNILGLEYTKAILALDSNMDIYPMLREGDHNDLTLKKGITSATSIRQVLKTGKIKKLKANLPPFVFKELDEYPFIFEKLIFTKLILSSPEELEKAPDCTEGLENRIKALSKDNTSLTELIDKVATKRYTLSRIRRILTANFLGITKELVSDCLKADLYAKILAVDENGKDLISLLAQTSKIPVITRKSDLSQLKKTAEACIEKDHLACELYNYATGEKQNDNQMIIV